MYWLIFFFPSRVFDENTECETRENVDMLSSQGDLLLGVNSFEDESSWKFEKSSDFFSSSSTMVFLTEESGTLNVLDSEFWNVASNKID